MSWKPKRPLKAQLVLEDGTTYRGLSFGARGRAVGEVCFNTGMSGYQEILTDPSYKDQIVVMTAPQMGNYGISTYDDESMRPQVAGFVVRNLSAPSNYRCVESLHAYLERHGIPALFEVDTRSLTRRLRSLGAVRGTLQDGDAGEVTLAEAARNWEGLENVDLAARVTCREAYEFQPDASVTHAHGLRQEAYLLAPNKRATAEALHVVVMDFGVKRNILYRLHARGCRVTVVPAQTGADEILALKPDGVLLSNGPGDPRPVGYAVRTVKALLAEVPIFGICLGHQILGLAVGGRSFKLKFGHRGANHPVLDHQSGKVRITSQNHGFALDAASLPVDEIEVTEVSLNDGTAEAIRHRRLPAFSVQYHPEASPGPHDNDPHFDRFIDAMLNRSPKSKLVAGD